jgi:hypothetical protein
MVKITTNQTPTPERLKDISTILDFLISQGAKEITINVSSEHTKITSEGFDNEFIVKG